MTCSIRNTVNPVPKAMKSGRSRPHAQYSSAVTETGGRGNGWSTSRLFIALASRTRVTAGSVFFPSYFLTADLRVGQLEAGLVESQRRAVVPPDCRSRRL